MTARERSATRSAAPGQRDEDGAFQFEPHHCFACGELNEHGLHLQIHADPTGAWIETTLAPEFQGWDSVAHGGIVCTILDEVMGWSVIGRGTWGVTARLNVAFRRPIPTGRPIRAEGRVLETHRRASRTVGTVLDPDTGEVFATAEGTFMALPPDQLERLKARYGIRRSTSTAERAAALGAALADVIGDPAAFAAQLSAAFAELADPAFRAGQAFVAPGIGPLHGVRTPLQVTVHKAFLRASSHASTSELLFVADRLLRETEREARWFAIGILERTVAIEPERSWQLLRRAAADADEWITVDTLAHPYGRGILGESYRWAEVEQLTVSPSRWERRLVGSTIATIPFVNRRLGRSPEVTAHALPLLGTLIGDREPDVQKALSWAYRSMTVVDLPATTAALEREATTAAEHDDGNRAWVVRDSLKKLEGADAERIRTKLAGIRRRAGGPSTSLAAALADRFSGMGLGRSLAQPPLA